MEDLKPPIQCAGTIIFKDNQILLVEEGEGSGHVTGMYGFPVGRIDEGESVRQTAVRELEEETGLQAKDMELLEYPNNVYEADIPRKDGTTKRFSMTLFICKNFTGGLLEQGDNVRPLWVDMEELDKFKLLPNVEEAIRDALNFLKK